MRESVRTRLNMLWDLIVKDHVHKLTIIVLQLLV